MESNINSPKMSEHSKRKQKQALKSLTTDGERNKRGKAERCKQDPEKYTNDVGEDRTGRRRETSR